MNQLLAYTLTGPGIQTSGTTSTTQLETIISTAIGVLTIVAVIFFTLQLIFAGYSFMSAQGDKAKLEAARNRLTQGILGLTIVVLAFGMGALISNLVGLGNIFDLNVVLKPLFQINK